MDLDNALPGHLVASVFEVLLVDAGYQVIPTGIKRTRRELRTAPVDAHLDVVHPRLRFAPDFFVFDVEARQSWLTEIKFRHYIHRALCDDLRLIQRDWAPFTAPGSERSRTIRQRRRPRTSGPALDDGRTAADGPHLSARTR